MPPKSTIKYEYFCNRTIILLYKLVVNMKDTHFTVQCSAIKDSSANQILGVAIERYQQPKKVQHRVSHEFQIKLTNRYQIFSLGLRSRFCRFNSFMVFSLLPSTLYIKVLNWGCVQNLCFTQIGQRQLHCVNQYSFFTYT